MKEKEEANEILQQYLDEREENKDNLKTNLKEKEEFSEKLKDDFAIKNILLESVTIDLAKAKETIEELDQAINDEKSEKVEIRSKLEVINILLENQKNEIENRDKSLAAYLCTAT